MFHSSPHTPGVCLDLLVEENMDFIQYIRVNMAVYTALQDVLVCLQMFEH